MTFRTLRGTLLIAFGVGVLTSAGQLGLGYGLGILRSGRALDAGTVAVDRWPAQLAWLAWFAMVAAVIGAALAQHAAGWRTPAPGADLPLASVRTDDAAGDRPADAPVDGPADAPGDRPPPDEPPPDEPPPDGAPEDSPADGEPTGSAPAEALTSGAPGIGVRVAVAAAAALGGAMVAPLSLLPAQTARLSSNDPVLVAGVSAALGAAVGLLAALAVLGPRPLRWNLGAFLGAGWLLALASVLPSLGPTAPLPVVRLGVFDPAGLSAELSQRLAIVTMPALALVLGAVTGGLARWRGYRLAVVASCGATGAASLSLAYLIAGPGAGSHQTAPYWGALAAAATGLLGSVLAATIRWPVLAETRTTAQGADDATAPQVTGADPAGDAADPPAPVSPADLADPATPAEPAPASPAPASPAAPASATAPADPTARTGLDTVELGAAPETGRTARFSGTTPHRPTIEDFWPSTPTADPPSVAPGASRADADDTEAVEAAKEAAEPAAPADRPGRSWRRMFRRPRPDAPIGAEADAPALVAAPDGPTPAGPADAPTEPISTPASPTTRSTTAATTVDIGTGARGAGTGTEDSPRAAARDAGPATETAATPVGDLPTEVIPTAKPARKARGTTRRSTRTGAGEQKDPPSGESGDEPAASTGPAAPRQRDRRRNRAEPELPAAEAEYVDWVSGLKGRPPRRADPPRTGDATSRSPSSGPRPD